MAYLVRTGQATRPQKTVPSMRRCAKCQLEKPRDIFYSFIKNGRHTVDSWCPQCWSAYGKARKARSTVADRKRAAESAKRWREKNPELSAASHRSYRARNPDKVRAWHAAWQVANAEAARAHRAKRSATKRNAQVVAFTPAALVERMTVWGLRCWMCSGPFEQVDHVKPLSKGGLHILSNLRPACAACNNRKHAKWFGVAELERFKLV